jgi:hypothetical protein
MFFCLNIINLPFSFFLSLSSLYIDFLPLYHIERLNVKTCIQTPLHTASVHSDKTLTRKFSSRLLTTLLPATTDVSRLIVNNVMIPDPQSNNLRPCLPSEYIYF